MRREQRAACPAVKYAAGSVGADSSGEEGGYTCPVQYASISYMGLFTFQLRFSHVFSHTHI